MKKVSIKSLIGETNIAIQLDSNIIPAIKNGSGYVIVNDQKLTKKRFAVETIYNLNNHYIGVSYLIKVGKTIYDRRLYLPLDATVTVLTGILGVAMVKRAEQHRNKRLYDSLPDTLHHSFYIGADPEMFVENDKEEIIPAFKFLKTKGAKDVHQGSPYNTGNVRPIYWDGFQAEFEVEAGNCLGYRIDSMQSGLEGLLQAAKAYDKTAKLSNKTTVHIPFEVLESTPEEFVQLGCMPSLNIYGHTGLEMTNGKQLPVRSAGGHIHFGCGKKDAETTDRIIKALDAILGVACVSLFANFDNPIRRQYYGLAGEYRTPKHGIEYRVLSNAWLIHPYITNAVFDLSRKAFKMGENNMMKYWKATEQETIDCINNCDVVKAREILKRNEEVFLKILDAANPLFNHDEKKIKKQYELFMNGIEYAVENPNDIAGNWSLVDKGQNRKWVHHSEGSGKRSAAAILMLLEGKKVA